ncbi:MAG: sigma-54 dependent transcriptional regulator [Paludibacteraceae bacterium]|nr:sigma-54 dependent transcriptional regulator [Paludibacteraceae bacterium]
MTIQEIQNIKMRYGIIGNSPMLGHAIEQAAQVAKTQLSDLITGENGVGKEVFSKINHDFSSCKHGPFLSINCGSIPEGTIDSELFGHVKGSFTDAKSDHKGYFEVANGGTLFLDEVGELPLSTQARLLRVLESGEFLKVGEAKVQKTNVRVVAATNRDLPKAILDNRFRQDLYYRLNGIEIHIPPLRDRRDDIPLLFRKFAADFSEKNGMPRVALSESAQHLLKEYYWAGNIRQLRNVTDHVCLMEAAQDGSSREIDANALRPYLPDNELNRAPAVVGSSHSGYSAETGAHMGSSSLSSDEKEFLLRLLEAMRKDIEDLHQQIGELKAQAANATSPIVTHIHPDGMDNAPIRHTGTSINREDYETAEEYKGEDEQQKPVSMDDIEKQSIREALIRNKGSRKLAALELKISDRTLYRKIKQYGL